MVHTLCSSSISRTSSGDSLSVDAGDVALQLVEGGGADDVGGREIPPVDPGQRHLRRVQPVLAGQADIGRGRLLGARGHVAREVAGTPSCARRPAGRRPDTCRRACPSPAARTPAARSARGSRPPPARPRTSGSSGGSSSGSRPCAVPRPARRRPASASCPRRSRCERPTWRILPAFTASPSTPSTSANGVKVCSGSCWYISRPKAFDRALRPVQLVEVDIVGAQPPQAVVDRRHDVAAVALVARRRARS